ncbi:NAD(P)-dependent oxidoreductase [Luteimicrobium subarcticum]|uniref:NAD(P)-dependent oxidoreductase n=1 Tax=Luteimicrobium subarcticum TaxID=620910 RepID=UPI000C24BC7F|nr:NAD(P)-dependent oxidoreductase [Luteimicrobium subarcticum]
MKILVPDTVPLLDALATALPHDDLVAYPRKGPFPAGSEDAEVLVAWDLSHDLLAAAPAALPALRLVQGLMAGPDRLLRTDFAPDVTIASGRGLHDGPVAEHALALVLAAARRLDVCADAQRERRWAGELQREQTRPAGERFSTLDGAHVVVWGFGSIAQRLAPLLAALGARVTGVASAAGERAGFPVVSDADLADVLPTADVLLSVLPALESTRGALDADVLAQLPRHAWFVNVGRGATVDEPALQAALRDGRIAGAALDVVATEPLPADSPWWDTPNVILTPHVAGGRPQHADELVVANVEALRTGEALRNVVDR